MIGAACSTGKREIKWETAGIASSVDRTQRDEDPTRAGGERSWKSRCDFLGAMARFLASMAVLLSAALSRRSYSYAARGRGGGVAEEDAPILCFAAHAGLGFDAPVAPAEIEQGENLRFLWDLQVVRAQHPREVKPSRMPEHPYLQWPVFRRSVVAVLQRSLTSLGYAS